jgi:hypothetical protein
MSSKIRAALKPPKCSSASIRRRSFCTFARKTCVGAPRPRGTFARYLMGARSTPDVGGQSKAWSIATNTTAQAVRAT